MADVMYLCTRQRVVIEFLSAAGSSLMDSEMSAKHICWGCHRYQLRHWVHHFNSSEN